MANEIRTSRANAMPNVDIDYVHDEVHRGKMWIGGAWVYALSDTAVTKMALLTGAKEVHMSFSIESNGPILTSLYEGPTVTNTAAQVTLYNLNRNFDTSPQAMMYKGTTVATDGTLIFDKLVTGTTGGSVSAKNVFVQGGLARPNTEWIFKPDTWYSMWIQNTSGTAIQLDIKGEFYEEG